MRIWYQLVSSPARSSNFLAAVQAHCDKVRSSGTQVLVRGTANGGFADQYAALLHLDGAEILRLAQEGARAEPFDVYAMANSLDPAMDGLREILDVPVVSLMEVCCFLATTLGERFGVVAPNAKLIPRIRDMILGYGHGPRLAGMRPLDFGQITDMDAMFIDPAIAAMTIAKIKEQAALLVADGAEVILTSGPLACLVAREGLTEASGAPVIDMYGALVKFAEAIGTLRQVSGLATSRVGRFRQPRPEQVDAALRTIWRKD